ncbi:MAG TPA: RICIN domain-containing protein [Streptosporangiaceae bacterium]|nr:RICIN domain-containing protein [Streptosporangiaceae bacterium]
MFHRKTGRLALAATATALIAASMVAVFATTAHAATYSVDACTAQGADASCAMNYTAADVTSLAVNIDVAPNEQVNVTGTLSCIFASNPELNFTEELPSWSDFGAGPAGYGFWSENDGQDEGTPATSCALSLNIALYNATGDFTADLLLWLAGGAEAPPTVPVPVLPSPTASATPSPSAAPVHLVRGFDGMCLRDTGDSAAKRTKIVIWACDPTAQGQGWTYRGDELRIHGDMCVNAKGRGTSGSPLILWPCNGSPNETWIHGSNGEYVLKANGYKLCLTDPAYSTGDGTQASVGFCSDARDQRWSLP